MAKSVSLKPSDMTAEPQQLDKVNKRVMSSILSMGMTDFMSEYSPPSKDNRGYLHLSYMPEVWLDSVNQFPANHIFLYSFCLADRYALPLVETRERAKKVCRSTRNEAGLFWLARRPRYALGMGCASANEKQFPAWSESIRNGMHELAVERCGTSSRVILIVYSCKAMLDSGTVLDWGDVLSAEYRKWETWLDNEISEIKRIFSLD